MCQGFEKGMRDTIMNMQNKALGQLVMERRGMAGEKALMDDLASVLAEDPEFAPWSGERFVTASAIRVIRSLRDRDESEVERDEAAARLFDCMAEDRQAVFVDDKYIQGDAVDYIRYLRSKIADLEGQVKELDLKRLGAEKGADYWRERTNDLERMLSNPKPVGVNTGNMLHAEKLSPEKWWIS